MAQPCEAPLAVARNRRIWQGVVTREEGPVPMFTGFGAAPAPPGAQSKTVRGPCCVLGLVR